MNIITRLSLAKLSIEDLMLHHVNQIRTKIDYGKIIRLKLQTDIIIHHYLNDPLDVYFPGKDGLHGVIGNERIYTLGEDNAKASNIMVRIPAVRYKNNIVIMDGVHRLQNLKPAIVVLDIIDCRTKRDTECFADLYMLNMVS